MTAFRSVFLIVPVLLLAFFGHLHPAAAQDATELLLRLDKLEAENRRLNGQIEQLQFQIKRQDDQFKRYQADAELRFKDIEGGKGGAPRTSAPPQKRSETDELYPSGGSVSGAPGSIASSTLQNGPPGGLAPGPRPLGGGTTTLSDKPLRPSLGAGAANPGGSIIDDEDTPYPLNGRPGATPRYTPTTTASVPVVPTGSAKDVFDSGQGALDRGEFEQAEVSFREFLRTHPKDKLVPEAIFGLGESFFSRRKYTEAAEQYLTLTTKFGQSSRAPEGMLKLGMSLRALGSAQEACATLGEVLRRYPKANGSVKAAVARERSRSKCTG